MYVAIRVSEEAAEAIARRAQENHVTKSQAIIDALNNPKDPSFTNLTPEEFKIIDELEVGELPPCCQKVYEDETPKKENLCKHWKKAYINYYGRKILHLENSLVGGTYFDYATKYLN